MVLIINLMHAEGRQFSAGCRWRGNFLWPCRRSLIWLSLEPDHWPPQARDIRGKIRFFSIFWNSGLRLRNSRSRGMRKTTESMHTQIHSYLLWDVHHIPCYKFSGWWRSVSLPMQKGSTMQRHRRLIAIPRFEHDCLRQDTCILADPTLIKAARSRWFFVISRFEWFEF